MRINPFTIAQVRAFWDAVAPVYDRINSGFNWTHVERFLTMQVFLPTDKRRPAIGNVWSRTGNAIPFIRQTCPDAVLENLEASPNMLALAQQKFPQEHFALTDLHDLPWNTESLDTVVSLETLEHVPDPLHFLLECHRVLAVGGRLILSTPPLWTEPVLQLYERFFENHGEGPHRFQSVGGVLQMLQNADFTMIEHRGTVLLPVGPAWLKRGCEWIQQHVLRFIGFNRLTFRHFFIAEKRRSRDPVWAKIQEEILRPGLSMHSGTEVGLSEGTLTYTDPDGVCLPAPTGTGPVPQVCYDASPEVRPSYPEMNQQVFGSAVPRSLLLGAYRRLCIAHMTDEAVRRNGASGGILTGVLLHLLAEKAIRGAVVLQMDPAHPWRAVPSIARTREDILASAQSKYVISPVNTILSDLADEEGPLAYVGLPHQVFAIRRLQQMQHPSVRAVQYVLGPFFGNELHGSAVVSFLRKYGATRDDIVRLSYRAGEWPGHMEAELRNGRIIRMPKFHANYLIPFHITQSSLLSHDLTNEFTDLSGGDAWAPRYEERGKGFSLLIVRTAQGEAIINAMESAGLVSLQDISEDEAVSMQSHGLDFKKRGTFLRLERMAKQGKRVPQYGLTMGHIGLGRRAFESLLGSLLWVCSWPLSRAIADRIPEAVMGPLFIRFRSVWKRASRSVKRTGLRETPIAVLPSDTTTANGR